MVGSEPKGPGRPSVMGSGKPRHLRAVCGPGGVQQQVVAVEH